MVREPMPAKRKPHHIAIYAAVSLGVLVNLFLLGWWLSLSIPMSAELDVRNAECAAGRGEQLWPEDVERFIRLADHKCQDKAALISRLLRSKEASIRAEGILLAARYPDSATDNQRHAMMRDEAINQFMESNAETARRKFGGSLKAMSHSR